MRNSSSVTDDSGPHPADHASRITHYGFATSEPPVSEEWSRIPHLIRSLLLAWATVEDPEMQERLLEKAVSAGRHVLSRAAPVGWYWALFPLEPDGRSVSIHFVAEVMEALVQLWVAASGEFLGRAQHIAHILMTTQLPEGCWQDRVDALTGEPLGEGRCAAAPLMLFTRLDTLLESDEFADAADLARRWLTRDA